MKRKLVLPFLLLVLSSVCVFAKPLEVWLVGWSNEMGQIGQALVDDLFTAETGIEVDIVPLAWGDYYTKSLLALASRDTPDIFSFGAEIADFAVRGGLIDLGAFKPEEYAELEKKLFSSVMGPFTFEARRFALPMDVAALVGAYRADILAEMGMDIPKTWEEIVNAQPKALARGKTFAFMNFDELWACYTVMTQHGGQFFNPDGFSSALDKPESIKGFINYVELFTKHDFPKALAGITPFISGEQITYVDGLWTYTNLSMAAPQLTGKWKVDMVPGVERDGTLHNGSSAGSVLLGISAYSKRQEEAWQFLKWFLGSDVLTKVANEILAKSSGYMWLPANKEAMMQVNLPEDIKQVYFNQIEACVPVPYAINNLVQYRYIVLAIQKVVLQNEDPKKAILEAAEEMNRDMNRRKTEYRRFLEEMDRRSAAYNN